MASETLQPYIHQHLEAINIEIKALKLLIFTNLDSLSHQPLLAREFSRRCDELSRDLAAIRDASRNAIAGDGFDGRGTSENLTWWKAGDGVEP